MQALAAATIERFGAVHVVCNNAGVASSDGDPWFGPLAPWDVGHGREPVGHRPRLPCVPAPPARRRPHRQHRVRRRPASRVQPRLRRDQARRRWRSPRTSTRRCRRPGCRSGSACCAPVGCAPTSSRRSATCPVSRRRARRRRPGHSRHMSAGHRRRDAARAGGRRRARRDHDRHVLGDPDAAGVPRPVHRALGDDPRPDQPTWRSTSPGCRPATRSSPR